MIIVKEKIVQEAGLDFKQAAACTQAARLGIDTMLKTLGRTQVSTIPMLLHLTGDAVNELQVKCKQWSDAKTATPEEVTAARKITHLLVDCFTQILKIEGTLP